jgi:flagellar basal body-associated protein FliL
MLLSVKILLGFIITAIVLALLGVFIYFYIKLLKSKSKAAKIYKKIAFFPFSLFWKE